MGLLDAWVLSCLHSGSQVTVHMRLAGRPLPRPATLGGGGAFEGIPGDCIRVGHTCCVHALRRQAPSPSAPEAKQLLRGKFHTLRS